MARKFTAHVVVSRDRGAQATHFKPGDSVPKWALPLIGDHVMHGVSATDHAASDSDAEDPTEDVDENTAGDVDDEGEDDSYDEWSNAQLKAEAKERGLAGYSSLAHDELVALLEADDAEGED